LVIGLAVTLSSCSGSPSATNTTSSSTTASVGSTTTSVRSTGVSVASTSPVASPGCRSGARTPAGSRTLSFSSAGKSGTYIDDVPATSGTKPTPIVFDLHGYLESAAIEAVVSSLGAFGETHGFVTITPQTTETGYARWNFGPKSPDIAWLATLLTHVEASSCIDERRVFVTGISMGAFTTSAVACELSSRIAAVAPVAGLLALSWCHPSRPVPVVAFHGTADPFVSFTGGLGPAARRLRYFGDPHLTIEQAFKRHLVTGFSPLSVPERVALWARRNGCGPTPARKRVAQDVTLYSYRCPARAAVEFYVVIGGGHSWPGSPHPLPVPIVGRTTQSISADGIMWSFFMAHPLAGPIG
jgi:polyhydroxybutyrate depolymerase